jgi:hypothetical protein
MGAPAPPPACRRLLDKKFSPVLREAVRNYILCRKEKQKVEIFAIFMTS